MVSEFWFGQQKYHFLDRWHSFFRFNQKKLIQKQKWLFLFKSARQDAFFRCFHLLLKENLFSKERQNKIEKEKNTQIFWVNILLSKSKCSNLFILRILKNQMIYKQKIRIKNLFCAKMVKMKKKLKRWIFWKFHNLEKSDNKTRN